MEGMEIKSVIIIAIAFVLLIPMDTFAQTPFRDTAGLTREKNFL